MVCSADWFAMTDLDPRLMRMLARHFHDLQGLREVAHAIFVQGVSLVWLTTRRQGWTIAAGAVGLPLLLTALSMLDRYYARFGRVVTKRRDGWGLRFAGLFAIVLLPLSTAGVPSLVWTTLAFGALWIAWDCRPYRSHHLLVFVAMIYVAFGRVAYPDAGDLAWMVPRLWAFASALALAGLLDHRLLIRAMRQTRASSVKVPDADTI